MRASSGLGNGEIITKALGLMCKSSLNTLKVTNTKLVHRTIICYTKT